MNNYINIARPVLQKFYSKILNGHIITDQEIVEEINNLRRHHEKGTLVGDIILHPLAHELEAVGVKIIN